MRTIDIIRKKRDGFPLTREEWNFFVKGVTDGSVPDYQASALLMACYLQGLDEEETLSLTEEMLHSGEVLSLSLPHTVDKHSTGGVGDGVSLAIAPIVAACGGKVAMMSGRGLGHTGGTLDKLDSIPGYRTSLSVSEFRSAIERVGCSIIGQTDDLAPADRILYALRDSTGTVENKSLITASILSKKLAEGVDSLVLDVKAGSGAFMKRKEDAISLANTMVSIARRAGKRVTAFVTDMDQPLGDRIGNSLEVVEAIDCLNGRAPKDYTELTIALSAEMLFLAGIGERAFCKERVCASIADGSALKKFAEMVENQGGDASYIHHPERFERAKDEHAVLSEREGYVQSIDAEGYGLAALLLGAGRNKKEDTVDYGAGITVFKKRGDYVKAGEPLALLHANGKSFAEAERLVLSSCKIGENRPPFLPLILTKID